MSTLPATEISAKSASAKTAARSQALPKNGIESSAAPLGAESSAPLGLMGESLRGLDQLERHRLQRRFVRDPWNLAHVPRHRVARQPLAELC